MSDGKKIEPQVFESNSIHEVSTQDGRFKIEMKMTSPKPLDEIEDDLRQEWEDAANKMLRLARSHIYKKSDAFKLRSIENRKDIVALFEQPIYVQEIENTYAPDGGCPWFLITTTIGHFKIGWRSRVLHVEWTLTDCKASAVDLFPNEDVTKDGQVIHAWSLEKAREYIECVIKHAAAQ